MNLYHNASLSQGFVLVNVLILTSIILLLLMPMLESLSHQQRLQNVIIQNDQSALKMQHVLQLFQKHINIKHITPACFLSWGGSEIIIKNKLQTAIQQKSCYTAIDGVGFHYLIITVPDNRWWIETEP